MTNARTLHDVSTSFPIAYMGSLMIIVQVHTSKYKNIILKCFLSLRPDVLFDYFKAKHEDKLKKLFSINNVKNYFVHFDGLTFFYFFYFFNFLFRIFSSK